MPEFRPDTERAIAAARAAGELALAVYRTDFEVSEKEASGEMTDMFGNKLMYNTKDVYHQNGILVTNGLLHDEIRACYGNK